MTVNCLSCGQNLQVPDRAAGTTVTCPRCQGLVLVPDAPVISGPRGAMPASRNVVTPAAPAWRCETCHRTFPASGVYQEDGVVICHGCYAAAVNTPTSGYHSDAVAESAPTEGPPDAPVDDELAMAASSQAATRKKPPAEPNSRWVLWTILGSVGAILVATALILVSNRSAPTKTADSELPITPTSQPDDAPDNATQPALTPWEQKNGPILSRLRSQAKLMLAANDNAGAADRYQAMLNIAGVADAGAPSAMLKLELDEARQQLKTLRPQALTPDAVALATPPTPLARTTAPVATTDPDEAPEVSAPETAPAPATQPAEPPVVVEDDKNWEAAHSAQILDLLTQADALAGKNKPFDALQKYQEVNLLVDQRRGDLKDAALKSRLAAADESRRKLLAAVRNTDESRLMSARALLLGGIKAESDGKSSSALDSISDARRLIEKFVQGGYRFRDNDYLTSLHAQAVAYLQLQQFQKAGELFGDTEPLGRLASAIVPNTDPPRALVYNRAISDITQKFNVMRTIKMLHDYMGKHKDPDEDLLNVLGTALALADENPPPTRKLLDEVIGFYGQRNMDIERTKPGLRRWGIEWMPESDVQAKYDAMNKAINAWQEATRLRNEAAATEKRAEDNAKMSGPKRPPDAARVLTKAKNDLDRATREATAAHAAIPRAPWLKELKPMVPTYDLVASATPQPALPTPAPLSRPSPLQEADGGDMPARATAPHPATSQPAVALAPPVPIPQPPAPAPELVRVERTMLAFPVDKVHLVTAAEPLGDAKTVRMEDTNGNVVPARVVAKQDRLALLEVDASALPGGLHYLNVASDFAGGAVRCVAMPDANIFGPSASFINAESIAVPKGAAWSVGLADHPRLAGSPLIDAENNLIGVVIGRRDEARQRLPAVPLAELTTFLRTHHALPASPSAGVDPLGVYQVSVDTN